jgi:hypothetical protein
MARDIFKREVDIGDPLAADSTRLLIGGTGNADLMVQNVTITYTQNINRVYEVGSAKTFFIAGRTAGTMSIKRIVGNKGISSEFIQKYADVCNMKGNTMTLDFTAGCTTGQSVGSLKASGVVINSITYVVAAQDMIINEDLSIMFARLDL